MEAEVRPTLLGKILNKFQGKLIFPVVLGITVFLLGIIFLTQVFVRNKTIENILSPVGMGDKREEVDPYYEKILSTHTLDNYLPNSYFSVSTIPKFNDDLKIDAKAYGVMDLDSKEILYASNLTTRLPIASIVKVMTFLVSLENIPLDKTLTVSQFAAKIGEASMGLTMGEKYTVLELLYGAMLPSGNDAAETLAEGVGKYKLGVVENLIDGGNSRKYFISEMNRKAQNFGMMDTYFFNPTGLDGESIKKTSFSTVLDLLAFGRYAMENSTFKEIVNTRIYKIPYKEGYHKALYLENILQLSEAFPGIEGIKPGNSIFARETLMSYINKDGKKLLTVILGSPHTKDDVLKIYKRVFQLDTKKQSGKLGVG